MAFAIELVDGRPARVIAETVDDLRDALALNGHPTTPRTTRTRAVRQTRYDSRPWQVKRSAIKPKGKAKAGRPKKRGAAGAGWTPEVYALAEAEGIGASEARKRIAASKKAAKSKTPKKPK